MRGKEEENAHSTTTTHSPAQPPRLRPTNAALAAAAGQGPLSLSHRKLLPLAGQVPRQSPKLQSMSLALQPRTPQSDTPKGTVPRGRATSRRRHAQRPPAALLFTSWKHQRIHTVFQAKQRLLCTKRSATHPPPSSLHSAGSTGLLAVFKAGTALDSQSLPHGHRDPWRTAPRWLPKASSKLITGRAGSSAPGSCALSPEPRCRTRALTAVPRAP